MRIGDVADVDHRAVDLLHREVVDPVQHSWAGIEGNVPLELADLLRAGWKHQIFRRDRVDEIVGRYIVRLHRLLIEVDLRLENFASIR